MNKIQKISIIVTVLVISFIAFKFAVKVSNETEQIRQFQETKSEANRKLQSAQLFFDDGKISHAQELFSEALSLNSELDDARIGLSNTALVLSGYDAARQVLKECHSNKCAQQRDRITQQENDDSYELLSHSDKMELWKKLSDKYGSFCAAERLIKSPLSKEEKAALLTAVVDELIIEENEKIASSQEWFSYFQNPDKQNNEDMDFVANLLASKTIEAITERGQIIGADSLYRDWGNAEGTLCSDINRIFEYENTTVNLADFGPPNYQQMVHAASMLFQSLPTFNGNDRNELHDLLRKSATIGLIQEVLENSVYNVGNIYKWKIFSLETKRTILTKNRTIINSRNDLGNYFSQYYIIDNQTGRFSTTMDHPHACQVQGSPYLYFYDDSRRLSLERTKEDIGGVIVPLNIDLPEGYTNVYPASDTSAICQSNDFKQLISFNTDKKSKTWSVRYEEKTRVLDLYHDNKNLYVLTEADDTYSMGKKVKVYNRSTGEEIDEFPFEGQYIEGHISFNEKTTVIWNKRRIRSYSNENGLILWSKEISSNVLISSNRNYTIYLVRSDYNLHILDSITGEEVSVIPLSNNSIDRIYSIDIINSSSVFYDYGNKFFVVDIETGKKISELNNMSTQYIGKVSDQELLIKDKEFLYLVNFNQLKNFLRHKGNTYAY